MLDGHPSSTSTDALRHPISIPSAATRGGSDKVQLEVSHTFGGIVVV